ncbi:MAG: hypothetical protein NDI84_16995 [Steroidobacteraceae bacterium]|nr:hypothetical protein [Steroidobacteraceae bacterium]
MQNFKIAFRPTLPLLAVAILGALTSQPSSGAASAACPATGAKVFMTSAGVVTLNGKQIQASSLKDALAKLSPKPTVICYSRENPVGEPHPAMQTVLDAIISMNLPVGLFTADSTRVGR